jgi:gamma-glutamylcysteine synthetase
MENMFRQLREKFSPGRTMTGHEIESVVVDNRTLRQPSLDQLSAFLTAINRLDPTWIPVRETLKVGSRLTTEYVTSVQRGRNEEVMTDMAIGIIEHSLPPANTLAENEQTLKRRFDLVWQAADSVNLSILGVGLQPFQPRDFKNLIPKPRYLHLTDILGKDLDIMSVTAAAQLHLDVPCNEAIGVLNVMLGFSPAIMAITANSAVSEGRLTGYQELRAAAWDAMTKNGKVEKTRVGIPDRFADFGEWFSRSTVYSPILTVRDGDYLAFPRPTVPFNKFAVNGATAVRRLTDDAEIIITPEFRDLSALMGTTWHDARLKDYGTVELRTPAFQPSVKALMAINALALGLRRNYAKGLEYLSQYTNDEIRAGREEAMVKGLDASMGGIPMRTVVRDMLNIARVGLAVGERGYLAPLEEDLEEGANPATRTITGFNELSQKHASEEAFRQAFAQAHRFVI